MSRHLKVSVFSLVGTREQNPSHSTSRAVLVVGPCCFWTFPGAVQRTEKVSEVPAKSGIPDF